MSRKSRYSPEFLERAARMLFDHQAEYVSQTAAMRTPPRSGPTGSE